MINFIRKLLHNDKMNEANSFINSYEYYENGMIYIPETGEAGEAEKSQNGKYIISWLDGVVWEDGFYLGDRRNGNGSVIFLSDEMEKISFASFERPCYGRIANTGIFSIVDISFTHQNNTVFVINPFEKQVIYKLEIKANVLNQWLSDDGNYCAIQACNSHTEDKFKFYLIDLRHNKIILNKELLRVNRHGFPDKLIFILPDKFSLEYRYGRFEFFIKNGELVDKDYFYDMEIKWYKERIRENSPNNYKAKLYRQIGEAYENQLKINEAINYYKQALVFDSKIGVSKKLKHLMNI